MFLGFCRLNLLVFTLGFVYVLLLWHCCLFVGRWVLIVCPMRHYLSDWL